MPQIKQFNPAQAFTQGRQNALSLQSQEQAVARERQAAPVRNQLGQLKLEGAQRGAAQQEQQLGQQEQGQRAKTMNQVARAMLSLPEEQWASASEKLNVMLEEGGYPPLVPENLTAKKFNEVIAVTQGFMDDPQSLSKLTTGQRDFASKTDGLSKEDIVKARRIDLGLDPRATGSAPKTVDVGGVPHIFDPIKQTLVPASVGGKDVTAETVGDSKKTIAERKEFGKKTGASRAKAIDDGFEKITKINAAIGNMDRAMALLDKGAGVGAIEKFAPSYKASSVELDSVVEAMALDVIGAVTFGALSEGELALAKRVALPTGLDTPALKQHLIDRKAAQTKLRDYFDEQIQFLDQGGSIAGFLRQKKRESQSKGEGQIMIDAQGNRARVFADGTFEEL
jgi:hypothetical protein